MNSVEPVEEQIQVHCATDLHTRFPIGYHRLHPNSSLNFQMNPFYNWVGDTQMLDEMRYVPTYC